MCQLPDNQFFNLNVKNISSYLNNLNIILDLLKNDKDWGTDNLLIFINGLHELWLNYDEKVKLKL